MRSVLHQSLSQRSGTRTRKGGEMKRRIPVVVERVWIAADHQKCFYQLRQWKLTDWIATDEGRLAIAGEVQRGST